MSMKADFALLYLFSRFLFRVKDFFHHWYVHGGTRIFKSFLSMFERIDRTVALRVTLAHFFEPLYKDYSFMGRVLGVIFRSARVAVGAVIYLFLVSLFLVLSLVWFLVPPALLLAVANGLFERT